MVLREQRYTLADLREIEQRPENSNKTFQLINGEVREATAPEVIHNYIFPTETPYGNEAAAKIMQEMIQASAIPKVIKKR